MTCRLFFACLIKEVKDVSKKDVLGNTSPITTRMEIAAPHFSLNSETLTNSCMERFKDSMG